jgi:hypothetical protein
LLKYALIGVGVPAVAYLGYKLLHKNKDTDSINSENQVQVDQNFAQLEFTD